MDKSEEVRRLLSKMLGADDMPPCSFPDVFPDLLYVLSDAEGRQYQLKLQVKNPDGTVEYDTWGLVCFTQQRLADWFLEAIENLELKADMMLFNDARKLAQEKMDVGCLFLLDDPDNIGVHWVK